MIAEAHEIREKQSAHRAHVINNVAIKTQHQPDDSVTTYLIQLACAELLIKYKTYIDIVGSLVRTRMIVAEP